MRVGCQAHFMLRGEYAVAHSVASIEGNLRLLYSCKLQTLFPIIQKAVLKIMDTPTPKIPKMRMLVHNIPQKCPRLQHVSTKPIYSTSRSIAYSANQLEPPSLLLIHSSPHFQGLLQQLCPKSLKVDIPFAHCRVPSCPIVPGRASVKIRIRVAAINVQNHR